MHIFILIGIAISSLGSLGYLIATLRGRVKPNRISYILWSIAPIIAFAAQIRQNVGFEAFQTISIGIMPFLIFLSSYVNKKAEWKLTKFDFACGVLSLLGLFVWFTTNDANFAILMSIIADLLAAVPTIIKSYKYPDTELAWPCLASMVGVMITFLTLDTVTFTNASFIIYIFMLNIVLYVLIQFRIGRKVKFVLV